LTLERDKYFRLPKDLEALSTPVDWIVYPFIPSGVMNTIGGQQKTSGKTTLLLNMIAKVTAGHPFLGNNTKQGKVVMMSEQPIPSLVEGIKNARLETNEDFHLWLWSDHFDKSWEKAAAIVVQKAINLGAIWLIIDTFPQFALAPKGISENDAGLALNALSKLTKALHKGLNVTLIRHTGAGKARTKDVAGAQRGSTAYSGAADVVMHIVKPGRDPDSTERHIHCLGRFNDLPPLTKVTYIDGEYQLVSEVKSQSKLNKDSTILAFLPGTLKEIAEASGISASTVGRMLQRDDVVVYGAGTKSDPRIFKRKQDG
jgi:hypothetical protein